MRRKLLHRLKRRGSAASQVPAVLFGRGVFTPLRHSGICTAMPKKPALTAFLVAIHQPDTTDNVYAILAKTVQDALEIAEAQEPSGPKPRIVGTLGALSVKRMRLKPGEARII